MKRLLPCAFVLVCFTHDAAAYVRSVTSHGTPTAWRSGCVLVQPDLAGSIDLDASITMPAIQRSMDAWHTAAASCTYFVLNYVAPAPLEAHFDGVNTIKFRSDKWCHPDDAHSNGVCYDAVAAGITTVFYADHPGESDDGTMLDGDVELNELNFTFDIIDPATGTGRALRPGTNSLADLENTLVHELGHLQGLDHTCFVPTKAMPTTNEVDENGQPVPKCAVLGNLSADERSKIVEATMFTTAAPGETKKRSPEADDVAGICAIYPLAKDPKSCEAVDVSGYLGKGCDFGAGRSSAGGAALLLGLALLSRRRRRVATP